MHSQMEDVFFWDFASCAQGTGRHAMMSEAFKVQTLSPTHHENNISTWHVNVKTCTLQGAFWRLSNTRVLEYHCTAVIVRNWKIDSLRIELWWLPLWILRRSLGNHMSALAETESLVWIRDHKRDLLNYLAEAFQSPFHLDYLACDYITTLEQLKKVSAIPHFVSSWGREGLQHMKTVHTTSHNYSPPKTTT